jgi:hypothetical protein
LCVCVILETQRGAAGLMIEWLKHGHLASIVTQKRVKLMNRDVKITSWELFCSFPYNTIQKKK